jgi:hypothetical protein
MPDMLTFQRNVIHFSTDSNDFEATLQKPDGQVEKGLDPAIALDTSADGIYTLLVEDNSGATLNVTLSGDGSPSTVPRSGSQAVSMTYQVGFGFDTIVRHSFRATSLLAKGLLGRRR